MLILKFCFGPARTNSYLLACDQTKKAAVIDPSMGSTPSILAKAEELGLTIEKILLTHSHWDHIADVFPLKDQTGAPVYVHQADAGNLEDPGSDCLPFPIPIKAVKPDHFVNEGDHLEVGSLRLEVIHTPGHSPGCVCFYLPKEHLLIAGDTLFKGSIGNCSFPTSDEEKMWESLKKLSKLPPNTKVVSGHGQETTIGDEGWLSHAKEFFS